MKSYIRFIVKYRFFVLGAILLMTVLAGIVLSDVKLAGSMDKLFLGDSPRYLKYLERVKQFGADSFIIVAFDEEHLFSEQSIEKLKAVVERIRDIPKVKNVQSILDLQDIQVVRGMPTAERYVDIAIRHPERVKEIMDKLRSDPLVSGLLISKDGKHSLVVVELELTEERSDQELLPLVDNILGIFEKAGFAKTSLHQAGAIPVLVEVLKLTQFNIMRLFPIVCLVLFFVVYMLFQRLWPVFITIVVTLIGVIWTMAVTVLLFKQINILTAMTPGIIMIIAFSDVIHLCSSYHMEISKGEQKDQAIEKSCSEVGAACLFTSLTTFFGFISMALFPAPVSRQLGVSLGVGVGLSLVIAMTLTPIILSLLKAPKPLRVGASSKAQFLIYRSIDFIVGLTKNRPWVIVTAFAVLVVFTIFGVAQIKFETDLTKRMGEDNPIRADSRYLSQYFDGTNYVDIFLESPKPGGMIKPVIFSEISAYEKSLLTIPEVDKAISVVDLFNHIHRVFKPEDAKGRVPAMTEEDISRYLFMMRMSGNEGLHSLMDKEARTIRVRLHLNDSGFFAAHKVSQQAMKAGEAIFGDTLRIEVTGIMALMGEWVQDFIQGQKNGLIFAFLTIFIIMSIALRSFVAGLWSMLPNVIPLLILGGYVGWFWDAVDSDTLMVGIIAIGISVDDTIHFLFRYRFERERTADVAIALDRTFYFSGRAIIMTSIILVAGFLPFAISDYFSVKILGTLLPITLAVALLADVLLVPAMIKLGAFKFRTRS